METYNMKFEDLKASLSAEIEHAMARPASEVELIKNRPAKQANDFEISKLELAKEGAGSVNMHNIKWANEAAMEVVLISKEKTPLGGEMLSIYYDSRYKYEPYYMDEIGVVGQAEVLQKSAREKAAKRLIEAEMKNPDSILFSDSFEDGYFTFGGAMMVSAPAEILLNVAKRVIEEEKEILQRKKLNEEYQMKIDKLKKKGEEPFK